MKKMNKLHKFSKLPAKSRSQLLKMAVMALVFGVVGQYFLRYSSAATGPTLYVSPSSATVIQNNTFNVEVRLNSAGQDVDGVEAYLVYPTDKIEFQGISEAGSAFGIGLPSSGGGGNITIRRLVNPDQNKTVSGSNLLVATVTMKALAGSGSAAVDFTSQSRVTAPSAGNGNVLVAATGGTYNLSTPPGPATPPAIVTNTSPTPTPQPSATTPPASSQQRITSGTSKSLPQQTTPPTPSSNITPAPSSISPVSSNDPPSTITSGKVNKLSNSQLTSYAVMGAKVFGGLLIVACLGMLVKLGMTWQNHMFIPHTGLGSASAAQAFVGGKVHPGGSSVTITPSQRVVTSPTVQPTRPPRDT